MSVFQCVSASLPTNDGSVDCKLAFPVSSCVTLLDAHSFAWFASLPLSLLSPSCAGWSSAWAVQHWSAVWPCLLHMAHVRIFLSFPWAVDNTAADEAEDAWHFGSSLQKAVAMVLWSRIPSKRTEDVNAPYSMCVNTQAQTHAQIHIHTQIPAYVQLPTLFQPCVPSQPSTHLHHNQAPSLAKIPIDPPVLAKTLILTHRSCTTSVDGNEAAAFYPLQPCAPWQL